MKSIRTVAYVSVALLIVSMLAIGTVSAGNGKMFNNGDGDGICDGDCLNDGVCPYEGDCLHDGECVNAGDCMPSDYKGERAHHNF